MQFLQVCFCVVKFQQFLTWLLLENSLLALSAVARERAPLGTFLSCPQARARSCDLIDLLERAPALCHAMHVRPPDRAEQAHASGGTSSMGSQAEVHETLRNHDGDTDNLRCPHEPEGENYT